MCYERRAHRRVPTKLTVLWEGLLTKNYALMTNREWPMGFGLRFANLADEKASLISQVVGGGV